LLDRSFRHLNDWRAFAGALAILMVGVQLTVMMAFYFIPGGDAFALLSTRWWWEVALNLQILSIALMWMCHTERISSAAGWRKFRAIVRLVVGLAGISTPFWTLVICARNDWFNNKPEPEALLFFGTVVFAVWLLLAYAVPLFVQLFMRGQNFIYATSGSGSRRQVIWTFSPFLLLGLLAAEETVRGGNMHFVMWPFLTYLHCAMPYLFRAFMPLEGVTSQGPQEMELPSLPTKFRR